MQRMKLHLSGVALPKLGSLKDRIIREYMLKEAQLEIKKTELSMLTLLTNPQISDPNKAREWSGMVKNVWNDYLAKMLNVELPERNQEEQQMLEYYEKVVKHVKPTLSKDKDSGNLRVSGIEKLL